MDPTHRIDLLIVARNEALNVAYRAQTLLSQLHEGQPVSDEDIRKLAAEAMRYKLDVEMAWKSLPWWHRAWIAIKELRLK